MKIEKIYLLSGVFIGIVFGVIAGVISGVAAVGFSFGGLAKYGNSIMISVGTLVFILSLATTHKIGKNIRLKENFVEQEEIKKAKIFLAVSAVILVLSVAGAFYFNEKTKPPSYMKAECDDFINNRMAECYNKCRFDKSCIGVCNELQTRNNFYKECGL